MNQPFPQPDVKRALPLAVGYVKTLDRRKDRHGNRYASVL
jgi:hypothetical protein